jgi:hypothetical protein
MDGSTDPRIDLAESIQEEQDLVEQGEAHVLVLLLLNLLLLGRGGTSSGGSTSGSGDGATTASGTDGGHQLHDVLLLRQLGEQGRPVALNLDTGGLDDGGDVVGRDLNAVIGADEGGVDAGKLTVGRARTAWW